MRPPPYSNIIAAFMGTGYQIGMMMFSVIIAITVAFANTNWRPYIYSISLLFLCFCGLFNGYVTSRYLKFFGTTDLIFTTMISAVGLPMYAITATLLEMLIAHVGKQATRYSFFSVLFRVVGYYLLNASMCYLGAWRGYV